MYPQNLAGGVNPKPEPGETALPSVSKRGQTAQTWKVVARPIGRDVAEAREAARSRMRGLMANM